MLLYYFIYGLLFLVGSSLRIVTYWLPIDIIFSVTMLDLVHQIVCLLLQLIFDFLLSYLLIYDLCCLHRFTFGFLFLIFFLFLFSSNQSLKFLIVFLTLFLKLEFLQPLLGKHTTGILIVLFHGLLLLSLFAFFLWHSFYFRIKC